MHRASWWTAFGLSVMALSMSACCGIGHRTHCCGGSSGGSGGGGAPGGGGGPGNTPQIVEIMRSSTGQVVGYVAQSPLNANVSWWLLRSGETAPVLPDGFFSPDNDVVFRARPETVASAAALCNLFAVSLGAGRRVFVLTSNGGTPCADQ